MYVLFLNICNKNAFGYVKTLLLHLYHIYMLTEKMVMNCRLLLLQVTVFLKIQKMLYFRRIK